MPRLLRSLVVGCAAVALAASNGLAAVPKRPNVVFILADDLGLADHTIFVFFSDNGGVDWAEKHFKGYENTPLTSNAPLRAGKETLYEGGTREPLVVVWPGVTHPGATSDAVVSGVNFFPTLAKAKAARLPKRVEFDGIDIRPALEGGTLNRDAIYCHFPHWGGLPDEFPGSWVRKGDWKLIRCYFDNPDRTDRFELYNLKNNVGERHDLAAAMPDKVRELNAISTSFLKNTKAVLPVLNPAYDQETHLRAAARRKAVRDEQAKAQAEGKW